MIDAAWPISASPDRDKPLLRVQRVLFRNTIVVVFLRQSSMHGDEFQHLDEALLMVCPHKHIQ